MLSLPINRSIRRMRYGTIHQLSDFLGRIVPKRGTGSCADLLIHDAITFLKSLEEIQNVNPLLTISTPAGSAIWLRHGPGALAYVAPAQRFLRFGVDLRHPEGPALAATVERVRRNQSVFEAMSPDYEFWRQWRVDGSELPALLGVIHQLPLPPDDFTPEEDSHPRYFPGAVREQALAAFEAAGSICPGAAGRKRHKVKAGAGLEFDHILPHARGGASTARNVQVLCRDCNKKKSATSF